MQQIDWKNFGDELPGSKRDLFEDLCLQLFCRKHQLSEGIPGDFNQAGLETEPVKGIDGKTYGFQSKFFDGAVDYKQIKESIDKALEKHGKELDEICIYLNLNAVISRSSIADAIKEAAAKKNVIIQWFTRSDFKVALAQPSNIDLTQLYFGLSREFDFIKDSADSKKITLLNSHDYLPAKYVDATGNVVDPLDQAILDQPSKVSLVSGDPASGKSISMHRLLYSYSGMSEANEREMIDKLISNGAIPQLIDLKHCVSESLESLIRVRQNDFRVRSQKLSVVYLLDGLDEIPEERSDMILLQISDLAKKAQTKKIVISCRSGNYNRIKLKNYIEVFTEYKIQSLDESDRDNYFTARDDTDKVRRLTTLKRANPSLLDGVTDILSLKLLWEFIGLLETNSTIFDLYEIKIKTILRSPEHYKDINSLNLPNQKERAILALNEKISYRFQEKFQFLFPLKQLQDLVAKAYPKNDYRSIDAIINYIASLFFDQPDPEAGGATHFVYSHRRFQEYFFVKRLQFEYTANPLVLRRLSILSNQEMMQSFFMKGLKKYYIQNDNLVGCLDLSLIDTYLGNNDGWSVDSPYYINSDQFIEVLVQQEDDVFNVLYEDESLQLKYQLGINLVLLKKNFEAWKDDADKYYAEQYLMNIWQDGVAWLIRMITQFWKAGRHEIANSLIGQIIAVQELYEEYGFKRSLRRQYAESLRDPYWSQYEDYLYYLMCINGEDTTGLFTEEILPRLDAPDDEDYSFRESGKKKIVNSYLRNVLEYKPQDIVSLFDMFDDYTVIALLTLLVRPRSLGLLIDDNNLQEKIKEYVSTYSFDLNKRNYYILFYKKYFGLPLTTTETDFLNRRIHDIQQKRRYDWETYGYYTDYAIIRYALGQESFELLNASNDQFDHYYDEAAAFAALFNDYVGLLRHSTNLESIYRQYLRYCDRHYDVIRLQRRTMPQVTKIWAALYTKSNATDEVKILLKRQLFDNAYVSSYLFHLELEKLDDNLFTKLTSESEIRSFENELANWHDDFQAKTDRYLELSLMYRHIDPAYASRLFVRAIIDGTLRHGWRKDPIVHFYLVSALGILLERKWLPENEVAKTLKTVYELLIKAIEISDGSGTSQGPYKFVELLAKYDREQAIKYRDEYVAEEGRQNISNSIYTSVILSMVRSGSSVESIKTEMEKFVKRYDYERKPEADYYEQQFIVFIAIADSDLYFSEERVSALESARAVVTEAINEGVSYFLSRQEFSDERATFERLCRSFSLDNNLPSEVMSDSGSGHEYVERNELRFVEEVNSCSTPQKLRGLYKRLNNYSNNIELKKKESWITLLDKTHSLLGNINPFIRYMKDNSFPSTDFYTSNSRNLYLALAYALGNPLMKSETRLYLFESGGHQGFFNVMKAYAELGDKEACLSLFRRFVLLCKLLTY
jgi:hypothetical protein